VVKRLLVNGSGARDDPTAANILDAIDLLKQAVDTIVFFIAVLGNNDGPNYPFLPTNAEWTGDALRGSTVVPWQILQEAVETAKGRRIMFVDASHSGNAYNQHLGDAAYHANIIVYTAGRFDQEAMAPSLATAPSPMPRSRVLMIGARRERDTTSQQWSSQTTSLSGTTVSSLGGCCRQPVPRWHRHRHCQLNTLLPLLPTPWLASGRRGVC
jgi:hypothetical protein